MASFPLFDKNGKIVYKKQMKVVPYPMIEKLVLEGERINRAAFMALLGIERSAYDYNEMIRRYKNAIQTMIC